MGIRAKDGEGRTLRCLIYGVSPAADRCTRLEKDRQLDGDKQTWRWTRKETDTWTDMQIDSHADRQIDRN